MTTLAAGFGLLQVKLRELAIQATGLAPGSVICAQPETAGNLRSMLPVLTLHIARVVKHGEPSLARGVSSNQLSAMVSFNAFAATHEQVMGMMSSLQSWLWMATAEHELRQAGFALWRQDPVRDLTERWETGYQPRAYFQAAFGTVSEVPESPGSIGSVGITGP